MSSGPDSPAGSERVDERAIAKRFAPDHWNYWYVRSKLAIDPLYESVADALTGSNAALLDPGCGLGLLVHFLRARNIHIDYIGIDNDQKKIAAARAAVARAGIVNAQFECMDLMSALPAHRGNVVLLDVLQYLPAAARSALLESAISCVAPSARLVMRTGLEDGDWRTRFTRGADRMAARIRWMNTEPREYPARAWLEAAVARHSMRASFLPCRGRLPFNNWLVVVEHQ